MHDRDSQVVGHCVNVLSRKRLKITRRTQLFEILEVGDPMGSGRSTQTYLMQFANLNMGYEPAPNAGVNAPIKH